MGVEVINMILYMKKILFITPYTPDNQGGGVSYTSQLLAELAKSCRIDLVYFKYDGDAPFEPVSESIKIITQERVSKFTKVLSLLLQPTMFPLFTARFRWRVVKLLRKLVAQNDYDFVYFDFSQTFSYARYVKHPHKILMSHDVIGQRYARSKSCWLPWVRKTEAKLLKYGQAVVTFSQKDSDILLNEYGCKSFPTNFFLNKNVIEAVPDADGNYFVFFGGWSRFDNYEALNWFLDNVYPQLKDAGFTYKIIGGGLPQEIRRRVEKSNDIEYLGFVDNPYPIIANARAEIAPLHYGAGVKVKCVEALGCGTPIIGTEVAFEGIEERYSRNMILANTPEEYVDAINGIYRTFEEKNAAKEDFIKNYSQKAIIEYIHKQ